MRACQTERKEKVKDARYEIGYSMVWKLIFEVQLSNLIKENIKLITITYQKSYVFWMNNRR